MKYIRMDLNNRLLDSDTQNASGRIIIDFFYSDRGGDTQRGHQWMLRSLLYQLLSTRHDMWNCCRSKFYEFRQLGQQHWQLESLNEMFSMIKTSYPLPLTIYILIDAMDESDHQQREDILNLLSGVCDFEGSLVLKVLVASRPIPRIASAFENYNTIILEEQTTVDIIRFTSKRMEEINKILKADNTKVKDIHCMIVDRSRGVFLWVKLVLKELEALVHDGCKSSEIMSVLEGLPQDLDAFYAHMLENRLPKIGAEMHAETFWMFQWVTYCSRPLKLLELTEAIAVATFESRDISLHLLKEERALTLDQANRMLSTRCGGFLEVKNGIVQFIHQTVRDFLFNLPVTSSLRILEHESIEGIANTCLRYLKFINEQIVLAQTREGCQRAGWDSEDQNIYSEVLDFLKSSQLALLNYAAYAPQPINCSDNPVFGNLESARQEFVPLIRKLFQKATHFDRTDYIDLLLQSGMEIDLEDTDSIRSYLENKCIDHYCFLACEGYSTIVDWLVSCCGWTVGKLLQQASSDGHEAGTQLLLQYGVADEDMFESLSETATKEQWGMVELLLRRGFQKENMYNAFYDMLRNKVDSRSGDKTVRILHHAASQGFEAIVCLLLQNGEDIGITDGNGWSALHFATEEGQETIVRQLLDRGTNKEAKTNNGSTALHLAAAAGRDSVVRVLIQEFKANEEAKTSNGSTALHLAATGGLDSTVRVLIDEFKVDKNAKTNNGSMPLHLAAAAGRDSTVRVLIQEFNANEGAKTSDGWTALHLAAAGGHISTFRVLIQEFKANKEAKSSDGWTALHLAATGGLDSTVRVLIDEFKVDKNAKTNNGSMPLHLAAAAGRDSTVRVLIQEFNADEGAKTSDGSTALHLAAAGSNVSTLRVLIQEFNANKEAKTSDGSTALHLAAAGGGCATVRALIQEFGVDNMAKKDSGETALYLLVEHMYVSGFNN